MAEPYPDQKRANAEGVAQLRRVRRAAEDSEKAERLAKEYLEQVRAEIEQDLAGTRRELEDARASLEAFVREENAGEKYRVPGLATAYLSRRRTTKVTDQESFLTAAESYFGGIPDSFYERKLVPARLKQAAEEALQEDGVLLDGVESEEIETLNVRLGKGGS